MSDSCDSNVRKRSFSSSSGLVSTALPSRWSRSNRKKWPARVLKSHATWMRLNAGRAPQVGHLRRRHGLNRLVRTPVNDCSVKVVALSLPTVPNSDTAPSPPGDHSKSEASTGRGELGSEKQLHRQIPHLVPNVVPTEATSEGYPVSESSNLLKLLVGTGGLEPSTR